MVASLFSLGDVTFQQFLLHVLKRGIRLALDTDDGLLLLS